MTAAAKETAARLLPLIDLTSLHDARDDDIASLCAHAMTPHGPVAAVCSWPDFVAEMKAKVADRGPRVAAVVNFPLGKANAETAADEARTAVAEGADELDLVMPYEAWLAGDEERAAETIRAVRDVAGNALLKVILETGALGSRERIAAASRMAISAGADFLKTSTGKVAAGASPEAAKTRLGVIRETGAGTGFKASGGIRTVADGARYLTLAEGMMGAEWVGPERFRIGASRLLDEVLAALDGA